jgi:hypothetical protein
MQEVRLDSISAYITEYISSGRGRKTYYEFPSKPDKDGTLEWLDANGFEELENKNFTKGGIDLSEHYEKTGNKCFIVGPFENGYTSWIMIRDAKNTYMVRFQKGTENLRSANGNLIMFNENGMVDMVTYSELKKEIDWNAQSK